MNKEFASKIPDTDLRQFVGHAHSGLRTVIVEVGSDRELPKRTLALKKFGALPRQKKNAKQSVASPKMNEVARFLKRLQLKESPTRLSAALAFVVKADARQLKAIAESPSVEVIRPNRVHRAA